MVSHTMYITGPKIAAYLVANGLAEKKTHCCKYAPQHVILGACATLFLGLDVHIRI